MTSPSSTYNTATRVPNTLISSTREPESTMGEEMRKEKVTPTGSPALVKPMKMGIDEQEQKGVTVPSRAATTLAHRPWNRPRIFLVRWGGK